MQLSDLIGKLNVAKVVGNDCIEITSVEADSRRVAEGSLFVAVRGVSVDGHTFIAKAEAPGASAFAIKVCPSTETPRTATNNDPSATRRESASTRSYFDTVISYDFRYIQLPNKITQLHTHNFTSIRWLFFRPEKHDVPQE